MEVMRKTNTDLRFADLQMGVDRTVATSQVIISTKSDESIDRVSRQGIFRMEEKPIYKKRPAYVNLEENTES